MEVLVTPIGEARVQRRFRKLQRGLADPRPAFIKIGESIAETNKRMWGRGVELKPETIAAKQAKGQPAEPLVATGQLKKALTDKGKPKGGIREFGEPVRWEMRFGAEVFNTRNQPYSRWVAYPKGRPPRKPLRFSRTTRTLIKRLLVHDMLGDPGGH